MKMGAAIAAALACLATPAAAAEWWWVGLNGQAPTAC